jgi:Leucine-rich repeat (LRR) protein
LQHVQSLSAEQQVGEVTARLLERNPAFDGELVPKIQDGVVTEVKFSSKGVSDISPLRALSGLKVVQCNGPGSPLEDFRPLQGMQLTKLDCIGTAISDLRMLEGLPLRTLNLNRTKVTDLSPLRGMPLTFLLLDDTKVTDLTPLRECPQLTRLNFLNTKIQASQVSALQQALPRCVFKWNEPKAKPAGATSAVAKAFDPELAAWRREVTAMPTERQAAAVVGKLRELNPGFDGKLFTRLRQEVVVQLRLSTSQVSDLSPLVAWRKLELLQANGTPSQVSSLHVLSGLPLKVLFVEGAPIADLAPLSGMRLTALSIRRTQVSDLSPLRGMPLVYLNCEDAPIVDLAPLRGCQSLRILRLAGTPLSSAVVDSLRKALPDCEITFGGSPAN